jgi:hypothetical protein
MAINLKSVVSLNPIMGGCLWNVALAELRLVEKISLLVLMDRI